MANKKKTIERYFNDSQAFRDMIEENSKKHEVLLPNQLLSIRGTNT